MNFETIRVFYVYPMGDDPTRKFHKDYTVPENEPFAAANAYRQWQRDLTIPHQMVAFSGTCKAEQDPEAPFVQLPLGFCETKYPGYFWDFNTKKLYSLKSGLLREHKTMNNPSFSRNQEPYYIVSHLGKRSFLSLKYLHSLVPKNSVIPKAAVPKRHDTRWR